MIRSIVIALALVAPSLHLPKRQKRLPAPPLHGATLLLFAPTVITFKTNDFKFRYANTNPAPGFDWALESSTDLTNWVIRIYPVLSNDMTVIETNKPKMFYRMRRRN